MDFILLWNDSQDTYAQEFTLNKMLVFGSVGIRLSTYNENFAEALSLSIYLEMCEFYSDSIPYTELRIIFQEMTLI